MGKFKLTDEFLEPYKTTNPNWGPLGWVTYKRTYARRVPEENRQEEWWETCRRVIEGNMNIIPNDPTATRAWAERAYHTMFHLNWLPAGRGIWISGTEYGERVGDAHNNCWFAPIRPKNGVVSYPFHFLFDQAMKGGGVGFSVERTNIRQIPKVRRSVGVMFVCDPTHVDFPKLERMGVHPTGRAVSTVPIADSREGWGGALSRVINAHFNDEKTSTIVFDLSAIRKEGSPIRGFGGVAAGPMPLVELLKRVAQVLGRRVGQHITSVDALDICCLIGRCVVAGNVRRTALIGLGDPDDPLFINAKNYKIVEPVLDMQQSMDWTNPENPVPLYDAQGNPVMDPIWMQSEDGSSYRKPKDFGLLVAEGMDAAQASELLFIRWAQDNHRWVANNSVVFNDVSEIDIEAVSASIKVNGEPGFVNLKLIQNTGRLIDGIRPLIDGAAEGVNPCGEISLEPYEPCNLVETFPSVCLANGENIKEIQSIADMYAKRVTFTRYDWPETRRVIEKNRRIGGSISGWQDWILGLGATPTDPTFWSHVDDVYQTVRETDKAHSAALGCNESIKLTTVKPSGTISLLAGVSPGIHWHYAAYYIRRIRFQKSDPLVPLLRTCGYVIEDSVQEPNAVVVEFPTKAASADSPHFQDASQVSMRTQIRFQSDVQRYWADNSVSATVTFQPHEADEIPDILREFLPVLKCTTLLPYSGHGYKQAPYEPITREEYERRAALIQIKPEDLYNLLRGMNGVDVGGSALDVEECEGGHCPIK